MHTKMTKTGVKGMTICHPNEFVQSHFLDGFLIKYLNMIIYYKIRQRFVEQLLAGSRWVGSLLAHGLESL